jgi:hypothetical protein
MGFATQAENQKHFDIAPHVMAGRSLAEQQELDRQKQTQEEGMEQAKLIDTFYSRRPSEINKQVAAALDNRLAQVKQQTEASERHSRQNRARSGNFGGSTEFEQNAELRGRAQDQVGAAVGDSEAQRAQLMQQMQFNRMTELINAFDPSGFTQNARAAQLQSMDMAGDNALMNQVFQNQLDASAARANEGLAQAIGGSLVSVGNIFEQRAHNQRAAAQRAQQDQIIQALGGTP